MGEQRTKTLRGGKMEDVIFGGTEKRSPMGFAQVSLILDNSTGIFDTENTEVMITRRYYRSGESEYSINREPCRLRDINELLMDTGLGRDGYSIIGRGALQRSSPARATSAARSLRRRPASRATATARRSRSANLPARRKTSCASTIRSMSWSCRSSPCASRPRRQKNICTCVTSSRAPRSPSGWRRSTGCTRRPRP